MERIILHIDMDAFFASVEQRDHPEWRGRPVIVGSPPDQRGVVSTCSYEARKFGVHSAMPSREAGRLCPQGIFVRPDFTRYKEASDRVFEIFNRFTPFIEPMSIDEAFLDVTGSRALFGDGKSIAIRIRELIATEVRITASVGVAPNKFLAKLASERAKPNGLFVFPADRAEILKLLGELPVGALWGVGKVTEETLHRYGYQSVSDLQRADLRHLTSFLGKGMAEHLMRLAVGEDCRTVVTETEEKSISNEVTFLQDCNNRDEVRETLKQLCEKVGYRIRRRGLFAGVGRLKLRWSDFRTITRQAPFNTLSCDDFTFRELAFRLFDAESMVQPVRLIGFGVTNLASERIEQLTLFNSEQNELRTKRERICHALDALRHSDS